MSFSSSKSFILMENVSYFEINPISDLMRTIKVNKRKSEEIFNVDLYLRLLDF
jgi:hypothetical protein